MGIAGDSNKAHLDNHHSESHHYDDPLDENLDAEEQNISKDERHQIDKHQKKKALC